MRFGNFQKIAYSIFDFILPPQCGGCKELTSKSHKLCGDCWKKLEFISCGMDCNDKHSKSCANIKFNFDKGRSSLCYNEMAKKLIINFKHGDATYLSPLFADWLYQAGRELFPDTDIIIPVPLHWQRLMTRRYNQASLLAKELSKLTNIPVLWNCLYRKRYTLSQGHKNRLERIKNLEDAFAIKNAALIKDRNILIVDDVVTTGATLDQCSKILKQYGCRAVYILTVAKVIL